MRIARKNKQIGFTLMEVLVVLGVTSILAVSSVPNYKAFMQRAYKVHQIKAIKDLIETSEIGITEMEAQSPNGRYEEWVAFSGHIVMYSGRVHRGSGGGGDGAAFREYLIPGYISANKMITGISWDPTCPEGDGSCWRKWGYALSCVTNMVLHYQEFGDGQVVSTYYRNVEDCLGNLL